MPDLAGQIWYVLTSIFFAVLLRWRGLLRVKVWRLGISVNKSAVPSFSSAHPSCVVGGLGSLLSFVKFQWLEFDLRGGGSGGLQNKLEGPSLLRAVVVELRISAPLHDLVATVAEGSGG